MQRRGQRARPGAEVPDETEASAPEQVELRRGHLVRSKDGRAALLVRLPLGLPWSGGGATAGATGAGDAPSEQKTYLQLAFPRNQIGNKRRDPSRGRRAGALHGLKGPERSPMTTVGRGEAARAAASTA